MAVRLAHRCDTTSVCDQRPDTPADDFEAPPNRVSLVGVIRANLNGTS